MARNETETEDASKININNLSRSYFLINKVYNQLFTIVISKGSEGLSPKIYVCYLHFADPNLKSMQEPSNCLRA